MLGEPRNSPLLERPDPKRANCPVNPWLGVVFALVLFAASAEAAVHFGLRADLEAADEGQFVLVTVAVNEMGDSFNGYDAIIGFDASLLELVLPSPASAGEEPLFTEACANRFLDLGDDSDSSRVRVSHVLLCAGTNVQGPGAVYTLGFRARSASGLARVELTTGTQAYVAGNLVATLFDDFVEISVNQTTAAPRPRATPELRVVPNPFNPSTQLWWEAPAPTSGILSIYDARGHRIAVLHDGPISSGRVHFAWDGRAADGRPAASGVYFARLATPGQTHRTRLVLLR